MKKVLFATTALVASAGIASAAGTSGGGITLSGSAEMGVVGGEYYELQGYESWQFLTSVDVRIKMTGTTNGGLEFGATVDLDDLVDHAILGYDSVDNVNSQFADYSVYIAGVFGKLTMGDVDGALDWAMPESGIAGTINDAETGHAGYSGYSQADGQHDGQIAQYVYSFGDFAFAASLELDDDGVYDPTYGVGATYSGSLGGVDIKFGVGYQAYENAAGSQSAYGVGLDAKYMGFRAILTYADLGDSDADATNETHYQVALGYTFDAVTVAANYGRYEEGAASQDGYGVAVNYDLGGGAVIQAGYGTGSCSGGGVYSSCAGAMLGAADRYSLGISMSF